MKRDGSENPSAWEPRREDDPPRAGGRQGGGRRGGPRVLSGRGRALFEGARANVSKGLALGSPQHTDGTL